MKSQLPWDHFLNHPWFSCPFVITTSINCQFPIQTCMFLKTIFYHNLCFLQLHQEQIVLMIVHVAKHNKKMIILSLNFTSLYLSYLFLNASGRPSRTMVISVQNWVLPHFNENAPKTTAWTVLVLRVLGV